MDQEKPFLPSRPAWIRGVPTVQAARTAPVSIPWDARFSRAGEKRESGVALWTSGDDAVAEFSSSFDGEEVEDFFQLDMGGEERLPDIRIMENKTSFAKVLVCSPVTTIKTPSHPLEFRGLSPLSESSSGEEWNILTPPASQRPVSISRTPGKKKTKKRQDSLRWSLQAAKDVAIHLEEASMGRNVRLSAPPGTLAARFKNGRGLFSTHSSALSSSSSSSSSVYYLSSSPSAGAATSSLSHSSRYRPNDLIWDSSASSTPGSSLCSSPFSEESSLSSTPTSTASISSPSSGSSPVPPPPGHDLTVEEHAVKLVDIVSRQKGFVGRHRPRRARASFLYDMKQELFSIGMYVPDEQLATAVNIYSLDQEARGMFKSPDRDSYEPNDQDWVCDKLLTLGEALRKRKAWSQQLT